MLRLVARPLIAAPVRARTCAFLTKVKSMEAASAKIAGSMPDGLKEIADAGVRALSRQAGGGLFCSLSQTNNRLSIDLSCRASALPAPLGRAPLPAHPHPDRLVCRASPPGV